MSIKIKIPKKAKKSEIKDFLKSKKLSNLINLNGPKQVDVNEMYSSKPYEPEINDLYRLYQFIILNKRTTVFEFGSGWSSLIFSIALNDLKKKYSNEVKLLRRNNPFELFILENEKKYLKITKNRIQKFNRENRDLLTNKINYHFSEVYMSSYNEKICTFYKKYPLCNPDFIYLDGPDQFNVLGKVNGVSTNHKDMMPMVGDILKMEYFYTPGTIIVSDGRSANIRFLKNNLQRNWNYIEDYDHDQHILWLDEKPLGIHNSNQIKFYKKN